MAELHYRSRNCEDCDKPLGGTVVRCHDCGGEDVETTKDPLDAALTWKVLAGIDLDLVDEYHN